MKTFKHSLRLLALFSSMILFSAGSGFAQTTEFSYQGFITDSAASANGNFDFEFRLYSAATGGAPLATNQRTNVAVANGVFSVVLDFGAFAAANRFLEIAVRPAGAGSFQTLAPRSKILSTPFATSANNAANAQNAVNATNATTANNALSLGGAAANQFVQTADARLSDARAPLPNSPNYIQNSTAQQAASNFNISGNGSVGGTLSANIVSAATQFNIGISAVLKSPGSFNFFAGNGAGQLNNTGQGNAFFGYNAGLFSDSGSNNAFFGFQAGRGNQSGANNAFFGKDTGRVNTSGGNNVFFGAGAGDSNSTGGDNAFLGSGSGAANTVGAGNVFIGKNTGNTNVFGGNNTLVGNDADVVGGSLFNATAIGYKSLAEFSNTIVLGSVSGKNGATSDVNVGIGTTSPNATLDLEAQNTGNTLKFTRYNYYNTLYARRANGTRTSPTAVLRDEALLLLAADGYNGNAFVSGGAALIQFNASENWTTTANGTQILLATTLNGTLDRETRMVIDHNGFVGVGRFIPSQKLDVDGNVRIGVQGTAFGCIEDRNGTVIAGTCSSDLRFKKNITPFASVLKNFAQLRPVNYFWRADEFTDKNFGSLQSYGLVAQEVERLFPDLVSIDAKGYKAINYSKLPLLTIQAVKELKAENDALISQMETQRAELERQQKQARAQQNQLDKQAAQIAELILTIKKRPIKARRAKR